jgi:O-antigen ligase
LMFQSKHRRWAVLGLLSLLALPVVMYQVSTPFKNKIGYVRYSIEQMQNPEAQAQVSDEGRLISYRFAWQHIMAHPLNGVGLGDVYDTMQAEYTARFGAQEGLSLLPHNQFLMSAMAAGIFTFPIWLWALFLLWRERGAGRTMRRYFWALVVYAMMIEPLFETQYGVGVFLVVGMLLRPAYASLEESSGLA